MSRVPVDFFFKKKMFVVCCARTDDVKDRTGKGASVGIFYTPVPSRLLVQALLAGFSHQKKKQWRPELCRPPISVVPFGLLLIIFSAQSFCRSPRSLSRMQLRWKKKLVVPMVALVDRSLPVARGYTRGASFSIAFEHVRLQMLRNIVCLTFAAIGLRSAGWVEMVSQFSTSATLWLVASGHLLSVCFEFTHPAEHTLLPCKITPFRVCFAERRLRR